jgi:hypothetical protein
MNAVLRRRLEMAARVRDFLRTYQTDGVGEGLGLAKLESLLERAELLAEQQRVGVGTTRAATKQRRRVRRALVNKLLRYMRVVGAVAGKQNEGLAEQFRMPPGNASSQALLTAGLTILEKATAHKEVLVGLGMVPQVLEELGQALGEFEQTLEASRAGRREHPSLRSGQAVGARVDLEVVAAEISEQVRLLDGVVQYRFGDNAELMGAWASARNVLGPFKTKSEPEAGGSEAPKAA